MTFRGLIGACVLLTAPAAAFGQKPTAAKQPVAADSAAAQPAEKQPAARIVVFRSFSYIATRRPCSGKATSEHSASG